MQWLDLPSFLVVAHSKVQIPESDRCWYFIVVCIPSGSLFYSNHTCCFWKIPTDKVWIQIIFTPCLMNWTTICIIRNSYGVFLLLKTIRSALLLTPNSLYGWLQKCHSVICINWYGASIVNDRFTLNIEIFDNLVTSFSCISTPRYIWELRVLNFEPPTMSTPNSFSLGYL